MYFQVCSNSAYLQHSGERYRTSGPLVPFPIGFSDCQSLTINFLFLFFIFVRKIKSLSVRHSRIQLDIL